MAEQEGKGNNFCFIGTAIDTPETRSPPTDVEVEELIESMHRADAL